LYNSNCQNLGLQRVLSSQKSTIHRSRPGIILEQRPFFSSLLSQIERKNSWQLAEAGQHVLAVIIAHGVGIPRRAAQQVLEVTWIVFRFSA
jgi:hypothetical protein